MGKALALAAAVFCCAGGCGLDNFVTSLMPPDNPNTLASLANPTFEINVPAAAKEMEFKGYELYYKFYPTQTIEENLQTVSEYDLRTVYGYRPVCSNEAFSGTPSVNQNLHTDRPLIPVPPPDRNRAFLITITFFSPTTQPLVSYDGVSQTLKVRRNVPDTVAGSPSWSEPKPFTLMQAPYAAYVSTDVDIQSIWDAVEPIPEGTGEVFLAMYVLSHGLYDYTTNIYSTPVYLGYTRISTDQ